jgi:hypothetical protein
MAEECPRDRAVGIGSKQALVQTGGEGAKELSFTNGPIGGTAQKIVAKVTERFAEVLRSVGECFYDVERFRESKDTRQTQQKLLPNAMA